MLKRTITYEDFDDNKVTETLYFNITKTELSDNLSLVSSFEDLQKIFVEKHDLTTEEIEKIFKFVKMLMKLSYGIRSPDGKKFAKTDDIWLEFTQTAAYDAFTFSLFENPQNANDFMMGIFPQDLIASANEQLKAVPNVPENVELPSETLSGSTKKELADMTREELLEAMKQRTAETYPQGTGPKPFDQLR